MSKVSQLFFISFVFLTDERKNVTPAKIELLHELLDDPTWCTSEFVRASIAVLRERYSALWEAYESGRITVDVDSLTREINAVTSTVTAAEAIALKQDLSVFVDKFTQASTTSLSRLGLSTASNARIQRQRTITHLLALVEEECGELSRKRANGTDAPFSSTTVAPSAAGPATGMARGELAHAEFASTSTAEVLESGATGALVPWNGRAIQARCVAVVNETKDTNTYVFGCETIGLFNYKPGQFISIEVKAGDRLLRRCYTISSSPSRPRRFSITVKRLDRGWISNWLAENMLVGVYAAISGPFGEFHIERTTNRKLLMLAAGSGVTPIISMLRWMADVGDARDVVLINSVRSPNDVIFGSEFRVLAAQLPAARIVVVPSSVVSAEWFGVSGRLSDAMLQALVPDVLERDVLMCGPSEYMRSATDILTRAGLPSDRILSERFGAADTGASVSAAPPASDSRGKAAPLRIPAAAPHPTAQIAEVAGPRWAGAVNETPDDWMAAKQPALIVFEQSGVEIACDAGSLLLEVAEANGVALNSACRSGVCGSCKVKKMAGEVRMPAGATLSDSDIADGCVLGCVGRVYGRVVVDR
ncbi:hybrid-cluster NAD(P)-dependent oxidoreductase [Burkholderia lata]|nr:hybrid-cluster NAD(P)-dependent oxidoreductase [Burkholderia lata]